MRTLLVSAYACEPLKGSEQGVGWNWVLQMAKSNRLHVITRANNQEVIEDNIPIDLVDNITFHYYDTNTFIRSFKKRAQGLYFYYFIWQLGIIPVVKKLIKNHHVDYTMHLTMGSFWMPTFLPFFKTPFIWGPVGGGEGEPYSFINILPLKNRLVQYIRLGLKNTISLNPFIIFKIWRSSAVICRTQNTASLIPRRWSNKVYVTLETAIENNILEYKKHHLENSNSIELITVGRLLPSKNIISIIMALNLIELKEKIYLTIIGSGPEKAKIIKVLGSLQPNIKITIIDELPRNKVLVRLANADIYVFPSLREGGSWALMEAMAVGLPVICLKWTGMEIITDDNSAIRLPVTNPEQMAKDMALAIEKLVSKPKLREQLGTAGRERIKKVFNWESKGVFMKNLLDELDQKKTS